MRLEGRRSSRNLPTALSEGEVVSTLANGDCFFSLVAKAAKERVQNTNGESKEDDTNITDYPTVLSLRKLVVREYAEDVFQLMLAAGQIQCTARTLPTFEQFKDKLLNNRAFADEHCIGIISAKLGVAFLILDDNIGSRPTMYWADCMDSSAKYVMALRLGREHYSGIRFQGKLLQSVNDIHPQVASFWKEYLDDIRPG